MNTIQASKTKDIKGAVFSMAGGCCWGLSGSMGQFLFQHEGMDSRWLVPIRLGLAGIILLLFCMVKYGRKTVFKIWKDKTDRRDLVIYGLFGVSFCQFLYFLTIQLSTAGVGTILQDLSPVMILLYGCITKKRKPGVRQIIAIIMALIGVMLITTHGNFAHTSVPLAALLTGVLCAVGVMIYNVTPGRLMERFPVVLMQGWSFIMGSIFIGAVFHPWTYNYVPSAIGIAGIAFVVIVGNVLAFPLYITGVKYIGPDKGILYGFSEPVTAAIISTFLLGSPFTIWDGVGFVLIFLMLALIGKM